MKTNKFCIVMFVVYSIICIVCLIKAKGEERKKYIVQSCLSFLGLACYLIYCGPLQPYVQESNYQSAIVAASIFAAAVLLSRWIGEKLKNNTI